MFVTDKITLLGGEVVISRPSHFVILRSLFEGPCAAPELLLPAGAGAGARPGAASSSSSSSCGTIIDAGSRSRALSATSAQFVLQRMALVNGASLGPGGCVSAAASSGMQLIESFLVNCTSGESGGGVFSTTSVLLRNSSVRNTSAAGNGGGVDAAYAVFSEDSTYSDSFCGARGGSVHAATAVTIDGSAFLRSRAAISGALNRRPPGLARASVPPSSAP